MRVYWPVALICLLMVGVASAQDQARQEPTRTPMPSLSTPKLIVVDFARPEPFDSNARLWFSLNQLFGEADRRVGRAGGDARWYGRAAQFVTLGYLNLAIGHYSHELGHNVHARGWSIDFTNWSHWPWPAWVHGRCQPGYCSDEKGLSPLDGLDRGLQRVSAGLNAEEYDAFFLYRRLLTGMSYDEGMAFVFRKLSAATYEAYTRRAPNGDVIVYTAWLHSKGISLSEGAFVREAALSDLLTARLWESAAGVWAYLKHGTRERASFSFRLGRWKVLPPLVSFYGTPSGGFYDAVLLAQPREDRVLEVHLGRDADMFGAGRVNRVRVGGEYSFLFPQRRGMPAEVGALAYVSMSRSPFSAKGWHAGVRGEARVVSRLALSGRAEYSSGDILENTVKWVPNGFRATVGLSWSFKTY
jgi:hypothetical protein